MNGRKLDWAKAKFDGLKGGLVPTGEDMNPHEEAKLQEWHEVKNGSQPKLEPTEREIDTLDVTTDNAALLASVTAQVEFRERARIAVIEKIKAAEKTEAKRRSERLAKSPTRTEPKPK